MNYTEIVAELANIAVYDPTDPGFLANMPTAIAYAEGRITRDLDLMAANIRDSTTSTVANSRNFNLPTTYGTFLIIDGINIITPANTPADSGTRVALTPVSRDVLDFTWPNSTGAAVPQQFAYITQDTFSSPTQTQVIFGPWPDDTYRVEVIGKIQPAALSATNTTTWLSVNLPELYIAACMVQISGFMRNFGSQADDPKMAQSWEGQYTTLLSSAGTYQARARFGGASWSSKPMEPMAQPQRG